MLSKRRPTQGLPNQVRGPVQCLLHVRKYIDLPMGHHRDWFILTIPQLSSVQTLVIPTGWLRMGFTLS